MLILSRRAGEAIIVDDKVTLTVLSIKGRQVRIGIDAPDDIDVHREEIYQKIKAGESTGLNVASRSAKNPDTDTNARLNKDAAKEPSELNVADEDTTKAPVIPISSPD